MIRPALLLLGALLALAASCSDDGGKPRSLGNGGDAGEDDRDASAGMGGASASGGQGGANPGGAGGLAGSAGAAGGAGAGNAAGAGGTTVEPDAGSGGSMTTPDGGQTTPPSCALETEYTLVEPLYQLNTGNDEYPLALTPDELCLVYERRQGTEHQLLIGEREQVDVPFQPRFLNLPDGYDPSRGAALSADGLTLIVVSDDGRRFGRLTRASRGEEFVGTPDEAPFVVLNTLAVQTGSQYRSPVLAAEDGLLFFSAFTPTSSLLRSAENDAGLWGNQMPEDAFWFAGTGDQRKLPSALSSDLRTLFFFDEASSEQTALWRTSPDEPFDESRVFAGWRGALPNPACDAMYTSIDGDLVRARPASDAPDAGSGGSPGSGGAGGAAGSGTAGAAAAAPGGAAGAG